MTSRYELRYLIIFAVFAACFMLALPASAQPVETVAGGNGQGSAPNQLNNPYSVAVKGDTLFIADGGNNRIQKVAPDGVVTTVAGGNGGGSAPDQLDVPYSVALKGDSLFIADGGNNRIQKVAPDGGVTTVAGGNGAGSAPNQLRDPRGVALKGDNLFIADTENHRIQKVAPDGGVTTVAGGNLAGSESNQLQAPSGVALKGDTLFIADTGNHRIQKVAPDGGVTTVAGGNLAGNALNQLFSPWGITFKGDTLFIADRDNHRIQKVAPDGGVTTVAGGNGAGNASNQLNEPTSVALNGNTLFIADLFNHRIQKVSASIPAGPSLLSLGAAFATPGDTVRVPITLTSDAPVGGLQALVIPDNPAYVTLIALEDSTTNLGFSATQNTTDDSTRLVVHSPTSTVIPPGTRTLARLVYAIDPAAPFGATIALTLAGVEIGDSSGVALDDSTADGAIQIGLRGDVNRDGRISILDVIITARMIVGKDSPPEPGTTDFAIADMNRDGLINVNDIIRQVNTILGIPGKPIAGPSQPVAVRLDAPTYTPDGRLAVPLVLSSDGVAAGLQATLAFDPALVEVGQPQLEEAASGLAMDSHIAEGRLRLVVYAMAVGQGISGGRHTVVFIPVTVREGAVETPALTLTEVLIAGPQAQSVPVVIETAAAVVTARGAALPTAFALHDARPNPFNPSTEIAFEVPQQAHISLIVYNLLGQEVVHLVDEVKQPGRYLATWDGRNGQRVGVASGVYLYRLTGSTGYSETRRMTLLK